VKLDLVTAPGGSLFTDYVTVGNFDIAQFAWSGDAFALSSLTQIYASQGESNFGKIGSPEIDAKIEETLDELDPPKARDRANELDKLIWAEGFSCRCFNPRAMSRCVVRWPTSDPRVWAISTTPRLAS